MGRYLLFLFMISAVISGCTSVNTINKNPNILLQYPYNKVEYIAEPEKSYQVIEVVQVTTRGEQANILNTIPKLYEKALGRFSYRKKVEIGNINIILFTRRELFWVPYDDCKLVPDTRPRGFRLLPKMYHSLQNRGKRCFVPKSNCRSLNSKGGIVV